MFHTAVSGGIPVTIKSRCEAAAPRARDQHHCKAIAAHAVPRGTSTLSANNPLRGCGIVVRQARVARLRSVHTSATLRVMIAGAPAAGKGTQCARIVDKFGLVHISVGDILRAEVAAGTAAGKKAQDFMDRGDLVPNEVVVEMVQNRLAEDDVKHSGWLLDGYPRSLEQAEAIEKEGIRPDVFLLIDVPDEVLVERVVGRRLDPETGEIYHLKFKPPPPEVVDRLTQRSDDTEDKVTNRLKTYHDNVDSVLGLYDDVLARINGAQDFDAVFADIEAVLIAAQDQRKAAVA